MAVYLIFAFIFAVLVWWLYWREFTPVIVHSGEKGFVVKGDKVVKELSPGRYRQRRKGGAQIFALDMQERNIEIARQLFITRDGIPVTVSLEGRYMLIDPLKLVMHTSNHELTLRTLVLEVTRGAVVQRDVRDCVTEPLALDDAIRKLVEPAARSFGVEVRSLAVSLFDLLPGSKDLLSQKLDADSVDEVVTAMKALYKKRAMKKQLAEAIEAP